jgi:hypothetical protein
VGCPTSLGQHPRPHLPRGRVSDVLRVPTLQFGDPLPLAILVEPNDSPIRNQSQPHSYQLEASRTSPGEPPPARQPLAVVRQHRFPIRAD